MMKLPCHSAKDHARSGCGGELPAALARYRGGELRTVIFRDLVLGSIQQLDQAGARVLDIGCGHGFHGDLPLQRSLAAASRRFIGVEPDKEISPAAFFTEIHACTLEQAALAAESIDVAYSVFVLEHVGNPTLFWKKLYDCLAPGGVFWGFTVDSRHWFRFASRWAEVLRLKDGYMNWLRGRRAADRYENYPALYRANSPCAIRRGTTPFRQVEFASVHRVGQTDYYVPRPLRFVSHALERLCMALRLPGSILIIKLTK